MYTTFKYKLFFMLAGLLSVSAASAQTNSRQALLETVKQNMQKSCDVQQFLDCSNMDQDTCIKVANTALEQCASLFPDDLSALTQEQLLRFEADFETCTNGSARQFGIDIELSNRCGQQLQNWN